MSRRRRVAAVSAVLVTLLTGVRAAQRTPARADAATLTRLRVTVNSSSDWATFDIPGSRVQAAHTASATSATTVSTTTSGFTVRGLPSAAAVIDAVVDVPAQLAPVVRLRKGMVGAATATVARTVDGSVSVVDLENTGNSPYANVVTRSITREALVGTGLTVPKVDARKLVLAFYYPWFTADRFSRGVWVDRPAGPYAADDPAAVASMVGQAAANGINGFVVEADGLERLAAFDLVLRAAASQPGFEVAPYLDVAAFTTPGLLGSSVDLTSLIATAQELVRRAPHGSYLHVGTRPVVAVFGMWNLTADAWAKVRQAMEAVAGPVFVVGDRNDAAFRLDGFHYYNPNARDASDLNYANTTAANSMRLPALVDPAAPLRLWAATVSPGENNLAYDPLHPVYRDRAGGARYDTTWRAAVGSDPDWIFITTWNEWFEATHVQPGTASGSTALAQTRTWAQRWGG